MPEEEYGQFNPMHWLIVIGVLSVVIIPFWKIFKKAGFAPWLSVLMAMPFVNFFLLCFLAFAKWPALERSKQPTAD
jgi:hypothetical protein